MEVGTEVPEWRCVPAMYCLISSILVASVPIWALVLLADFTLRRVELLFFLGRSFFRLPSFEEVRRGCSSWWGFLLGGGVVGGDMASTLISVSGEEMTE